MSAEMLRRAAGLMRERAEVATDPGGTVDYWLQPSSPDLAHLLPDEARHIASWHPSVALAVADWLDAEATSVEFDGGRPDLLSANALNVARTYLGEQA